MKYHFCGHSGLQLPAMSLGLWQNFGGTDDFRTVSEMITGAFDRGITHFDLANNYGPPPGSAEVNFGKVLTKELKGHRDEIIVASKAGHRMWEGHYGDGASRKSIIASLHQSLKRTGVDYFDIFYSHRYDGQTPVEETVQTLIDIVRQGKALYVGISKYPVQKAEEAYRIMQAQHVPCLIYQDRYNLLNRTPEEQHFACNKRYGTGFVAFSPLAQGLLSGKYLNGIPDTSRVRKGLGYLQTKDITPETQAKVAALQSLAQQRGQPLAEMSLAWLLSHEEVTSVIIGVGSLQQMDMNLKALDSPAFSEEERRRIDEITRT
ncbi:MAG: aldo/keto reductase [Bacteroidales bacterium]|jgi:L-glyceraldehyde 3-phosphate reductase|nr:aldo/keto reductase [Bacteroidales bacterium]